MGPSSKAEFFVNPTRFNYLLEQYKISPNKFIEIINKDRKRDLYDLDRLNRILNKEEKVSKSFLTQF